MGVHLVRFPPPFPFPASRAGTKRPILTTSAALLALIAGHDRSRALVVVTIDLGEFSRANSLRCEDWLLPH